MPTLQQSNQSTAVSQNERIRELDLIRGFALLGILIANIPLFSYPYTYVSILETGWWPGIGDQAVKWFIYLFIDYKFVSMFSFLFGLGFMIFLQRSRQKGGRSAWLYMKRLLFLLALALIHAYLIWAGDILLPYVMLGFFLLLFRNSTANTLLSWGCGLLIISSILLTIQTFVFNNVLSGLAPSQDMIRDLIQKSVYAYGQGTYVEIFNHRLIDMSILQESNPFMLLLIFSMFLLGAYAGKKELFTNLSKKRELIKKIWTWSFVIGAPFVILQIILRTEVDAMNDGYNMAHAIGIMISGPAICFFYITSILLLLKNKKWKNFLSPLQAVGRMALTNYLMQSIVCTFLFYSYGLGWYGKVSPVWGLVISFILFILQVVASNIWMRYYMFGPLEWVWRTVTYGKRQPMKIKSSF